MILERIWKWEALRWWPTAVAWRSWRIGWSRWADHGGQWWQFSDLREVEEDEHAYSFKFMFFWTVHLTFHYTYIPFYYISSCYNPSEHPHVTNTDNCTSWFSSIQWTSSHLHLHHSNLCIPIKSVPAFLLCRPEWERVMDMPTKWWGTRSFRNGRQWTWMNSKHFWDFSSSWPSSICYWSMTTRGV